MKSAAVGRDCVLDILALDAHQLDILAAIHAARKPAEEAGREEEAAGPSDGYTSD